MCSVQVDKPLTLQDVFRIKRDQFEGTQFDLTNDVAGGPFGDPIRWMYMAKWEDEVNGLTWEDYNKGQSLTSGRWMMPSYVSADLRTTG
jgi:dipeptidase